MPTDTQPTGWRRTGTGLRLRLISFCVVIAVISIGTTAWIAVGSTSSSINEEYTQNLTSVAAVYNQLSGYAATHSTWSGVGPAVTALAREKHTQITLTRGSGTIIANSGRTTPALTGVNPAALINPLQPDTSVGDVSVIGGLDSRIIGPYSLTTAEKAAIGHGVQVTRTCYEQNGNAALPIQTFPNGRQYLPTLATVSHRNCPVSKAILDTTTTERTAGTALTSALTRCIPQARTDPPGVLVITSYKGEQGNPVYLPEKIVLDSRSAGFPNVVIRLIDDTSGSTQACVVKARQAQLAPFTAPPAQLYLSIATPRTRHGLSAVGLHRIILAGTAILLLTLLACFVAATRLRRPLAALTAAVTSTAAGARNTPVPLRGTSEMRELATAVNDLAVQLDNADQRRKDMVSDVAHELRTPLANIRGWMEAMHDEVVPPSQALIGRLLDEALLLQQLIDELQDLAQADAGQLVIHREPVDVAALAQQVATAAVAPAPGVAVTVKASGDTLMQLDPVRIRQILANLLSNARRATDAGTVVITVTGHPDHLVLEVSDTGRGIAAEDVPHLFDRFWRADKSRSRTQGGSGLGLAITQALVTAHGGRVEVRSRLGSGTTVTVNLPRTESPADAGSV